MLLDAITLPVNLVLSSQSKALLKTLIGMEGEATPATQSAPLTPPAAGEYWPGQGGYYICTLPALQDMPARHLIAGKGEHEGLPYGPHEDAPGATSQINGTANTASLICAGKDNKAAHWATAYTADGHTDFFLPARLDLFMAHICAPQLFKKSGYYWTSTQYSSYGAFAQDFEYGYSGWDSKAGEFRVRAFRAVPL